MCSLTSVILDGAEGKNVTFRVCRHLLHLVRYLNAPGFLGRDKYFSKIMTITRLSATIPNQKTGNVLLQTNTETTRCAILGLPDGAPVGWCTPADSVRVYPICKALAMRL